MCIKAVQHQGVYKSSQAPRQTLHNGAQQRNVHLAGFSPTNNDLSAWFNNIVAGHASLNRLTDAIVYSFKPLQQNAAQHTPIDIAWDYHKISSLMSNAICTIWEGAVLYANTCSFGWKDDGNFTEEK